MAAEVVGQFLDDVVGHVGVHLQGEPCMWCKSLISMGKCGNLSAEVTDSGS